jgi:hypothetical protein
LLAAVTISGADATAVPTGENNGPFEMTDEYKHNARKIGKKRVELAGARLAKLLTRS